MADAGLKPRRDRSMTSEDNKVRWLDRLLRRPRRIEVSPRCWKACTPQRPVWPRSRAGSMQWPTISPMRARRATSTSAWPTATWLHPGRRGATTAIRVGSGAAASMIGRDNAQGASQETGRALDIAIEGPGYMQVRSGAQRSLTRDGNLQIDGQGRLAMQDGALLDPPVTLPQGTTEDQVAIGADGTVSVGRQGRRQDHPRQRRQPRRPRRRRRQPLPGHRRQRRHQRRPAHDGPALGRARELQRRHGRRR